MAFILDSIADCSITTLRGAMYYALANSAVWGDRLWLQWLQNIVTLDEQLPVTCACWWVSFEARRCCMLLTICPVRPMNAVPWRIIAWNHSVSPHKLELRGDMSCKHWTCTKWNNGSRWISTMWNCIRDKDSCHVRPQPTTWHLIHLKHKFWCFADRASWYNFSKRPTLPYNSFIL